jgi:hypothetical protein
LSQTATAVLSTLRVRVFRRIPKMKVLPPLSSHHIMIVPSGEAGDDEAEHEDNLESDYYSDSSDMTLATLKLRLLCTTLLMVIFHLMKMTEGTVPLTFSGYIHMSITGI